MRKKNSHSPNQAPEPILNSPYTAGLIRRKAKQIIGRAGFTDSDLEDIQQDIYLKLVKQIAAFDPQQSHPNVFITTVVERYVANILRDKLAEKRNHRRVSSLNVVIGNEGECGIELGDTISDREANAHLFRSMRSQQELAEMRMEIDECLKLVSHDLRDALERVMAGNSMSQVAVDTGIPRTTLQDRARKLRERFEDMGLKDYL